MSTTYRIGPAVILTSASVSDPLSDWTEIHRTRGGITVTMPDSMVARGRTNEHMAPLAAWYAPGQATVSYKMVNRDIATMAAQVHRSTAMSASAKQALKIDAKLAAITPVSVAIVPLSEYNDDKQFLGAANAVVFEKAIFRVGEMASTVDVETDDLDGYMVTVESVNGVVTVGYPEVGMPELNPQGLLFLWQPSIDAVTPLVGEGAGTFTRATTATYVDDDGVIQSVASGQPRYQDGGLLLEPQRTNLTLYSSDLTQTAWALVGAFNNWIRAPYVSNDGVAPDGTTTADKVTFTNALHTQTQRYTVTPGATYTLSVYLKKHSTSPEISANEVNLHIATGLSGALVSSVFSRLSVGELLNDTWQRFSHTFTVPASGVNQIEAGISTANVFGSPDAIVLCWGFQLEAASYPTSYIPTSGSTVTRNADQLTFPFTTALRDMSAFLRLLPKSAASAAGTGDVFQFGQGPSTSTNQYRFAFAQYNGGTNRFFFEGPNDVGNTEVVHDGAWFAETQQDLSAQVRTSTQDIGIYNAAETATIDSASVMMSTAWVPDDSEMRIAIVSPNVHRAAVLVSGLLTPAQLRRILR